MSKLLRELKWLVASFVIVGLAIGSIYSVAVFCQWRVEVNAARIDAGEIEMVTYTIWR